MSKCNQIDGDQYKISFSFPDHECSLLIGSLLNIELIMLLTYINASLISQLQLYWVI